MVYMVAVGLFSHFSKIFLVIFPPHCTHHLQSLDVAGMEPLSQNILLHKTTG